MNKRKPLAPNEGAAAPQTVKGAKWREKMEELAGEKGKSKQVEAENRTEGTKKAEGGKKVHSINMSL